MIMGRPWRRASRRRWRESRSCLDGNATDHARRDRRTSTTSSPAAGPPCANSKAPPRSRSTASARPSAGPSPTRRPSRGSRTWASTRAGSAIARAGSRSASRSWASCVTSSARTSIGVIETLPDEGHRQVREAGRPHRVARPDDEPRAHAARRRDVRHQVSRRRHLLAASPEQADDAGRRSRSCVGRSRARALRRTSSSASSGPSIPAAQYLMTQADLVQATGGRDMVKAAYSSGTPAYGVGAGNSTMVIDETADVVEAARNTRSARPRTTAPAAPRTATWSSTTASTTSLRERLVAEGGHVTSPTRRSGCEPCSGTTTDTGRPTRSRSRRRPSPSAAGLRDRARPDLLRRRADRDRPPQRVQLGEAQRRPVDVPLRDVR